MNRVLRRDVLTGCIALVACTSPAHRSHDEGNNSTNVKKSSIEKIELSRGSDYLDDIYDQAVASDSQLQAIEKEIHDFDEMADDSLQSANALLAKNDAFFSRANSIAKSIDDSLLRKEMQALLKQALVKDSAVLKAFKGLLANIDQHDAGIKSYHKALKIAVVLPLVQQSHQAANKKFPELKTVNQKAAEMDNKTKALAQQKLKKIKEGL